MDRRNFLSLAALALAGDGLRRAWPFRVYSFPSDIKIVSQEVKFASVYGIQPGSLIVGHSIARGTFVDGDIVEIFSPAYEFRGTYRMVNGLFQEIQTLPLIVHQTNGEGFLGLTRSPDHPITRSPDRPSRRGLL